LDVVVRSRVESRKNVGFGGGGFGIDGNVDPNSGSSVGSVGNVPFLVGLVGPQQRQVVVSLLHNLEGSWLHHGSGS